MRKQLFNAIKQGLLARHLYAFGEFRLDLYERHLLRGDEQIPLAPKVFDLLVALVEHQGQILEKDELAKLIWPQTVPSESNLSAHITALRKALGEAPGQRHYIETLPRRGYRFVASVRDERSDLIVQQRTSAGILIEEELEGEAVTRRRGEETREANIKSTTHAVITKEQLEETIRGVIREFKRSKRIPDPTADELRAALEARVDDLFDQEETLQSIGALPGPVPSSDSEFEADMHAFAEGTEHLPAYSGTYSRTDIYFDHD